jgi:hypothetical protein
VTTAELPDERQRQRLAALADTLMPGAGALPSPSEAGAHHQGIDRVLRTRPDLAPVIRAAASAPGSAAEYLAALRASDQAAFSALAYALAAAYLTVPQVRRALGYPGAAPRRSPAPPDEADYYLEDGILQPVLDRGSIFRPVTGDAADPGPAAGQRDETQ